MPKEGVPRRWLKYVSLGRTVDGTRFVPFKTPLSMSLLHHRPEYCWFTPLMVREKVPELKAVIDLTGCNGRYDPMEFTDHGIIHIKLAIAGGWVPSLNKLQQFFDAVDELSDKLADDPDALIGVHCTHGLNRTGYLICKYMVTQMKIDPQEAISRFEEARGHRIERQKLRNDLTKTIPTTNNKSSSSSSNSNNKRRRNSKMNSDGIMYYKRKHVGDGLDWRKR